MIKANIEMKEMKSHILETEQDNIKLRQQNDTVLSSDPKLDKV